MRTHVRWPRHAEARRNTAKGAARHVAGLATVCLSCRNLVSSRPIADEAGALAAPARVTQDELIRATGISRSTYLRLERGQVSNPPLRYPVNCALALGCELDDLVEDAHREWLVLDIAASAPPDPEGFWTAEEPSPPR